MINLPDFWNRLRFRRAVLGNQFTLANPRWIVHFPENKRPIRSNSRRRQKTMLWWTYQQLRMGSAKSRLAVIEKLAASQDEQSVGPLIFALKDKAATVRCLQAKTLTRYRGRGAV